MPNRSHFLAGLLTTLLALSASAQDTPTDPANADGYTKRGEAKLAKNDFAGAITDFNQAIALNPKSAEAYNGRGYAEYSLFDMKSAMADQNRALEIDPSFAIAYFARGQIHAAQGELDAGLADYRRALQDPKYGAPYYPVAIVEMAQGQLSQAHDDILHYLRSPWRSEEGDYARMMLWLILSQQKNANDADLELSASFDKKLDAPNNWNSAPDDWASKDAAFLLGRMNESDYLAAASSSDPLTDRGQHCEAWYYSGMKRLLAGDNAGALDHFKKSVATNRIDYVEYLLAKSEIQALNPPK